MTEFATLQHATYTEAEWTAWDGVLLAGQVGYSSDALYSGTNQMKVKIGNGTDTWTDLDYVPEPSGFTGGSLTSAINEAKGSDIASAATTDIGAATGNFVHVTGTTTITALGTIQAGTRRIVRFAGALILTHNATSLILPTGANITTAANDVATFVSEGSGNWRCVNYMRADGSALASGLSGTSNEIAYFNSATSVSSLSTSTYPSLTELSRLKGVTSDIQTQINSKGYTLIGGTSATSLADSTTYFFGGVQSQGLLTSESVTTKMLIPKTGTIKSVQFSFIASGSNEASTMLLRLNGTTDYIISTTTDMSSNLVANYALSIPVTQGDSFCFKWTTPAWGTNPANLRFHIVVYIE